MSTKGKEQVALRRVDRNDYGDREVTNTLVVFMNCAVIPRTLGEDSERGSVAVAGHQVYVPPQRAQWSASVDEEDREVKDTDQLHVRGEWTDIEGHPADYVDLKGRAKGTIITTRGEVVAG